MEVSKLVEYAVFDQVFKHFDENNLLHPNHHGSLPNHNTATAIIQLYNIWLEAAEEDKLSAALLLDLSGAFDMVSHSILLKKLRLYGFTEDTIRFFKEYLEERKMVVQVESKRSEPKDIGDNGVPQGSILGVLIFITVSYTHLTLPTKA